MENLRERLATNADTLGAGFFIEALNQMPQPISFCRYKQDTNQIELLVPNQTWIDTIGIGDELIINVDDLSYVGDAEINRRRLIDKLMLRTSQSDRDQTNPNEPVSVCVNDVVLELEVIPHSNQTDYEGIFFIHATKKEFDIYRRVLDGLGDAVVVTKPDGTRLFVNDTYCQMFGLTRDEAIGTSFFTLIDDTAKELVQKKYAGISPEEPFATDIHEVLLPDGSLGYQEWTEVGVFDENGDLIEIMSVGKDITERHMRLRAELAAEQAHEFTSHIAHELKTPISAILLHASLAQMNQAKAGEYLDKIKNQALRLDDMIESLRRLYKIESGQAEYDPINITIDELIAPIAEDFQQQGDTNTEIHLSFEVPDDPLVVNADPGLIRVLMDTLIDNALKYCPQGNINVVVAPSEDTNNVQFVVKDDGVGIKQDELLEIFERFNRGTNPAAKHIQGSGIGLTIAAAVARLHSTQINAFSEGPGKGSQFSFNLPMILA